MQPEKCRPGRACCTGLSQVLILLLQVLMPKTEVWVREGRKGGSGMGKRQAAGEAAQRQ